MLLNGRTSEAVDSPIGAAYALLDQRGGRHELLDLSQAAPPYPAAPVVVDRIARVAREPNGGGYTDVPGIPELRDAIAAELCPGPDPAVRREHVVVTAGCNQAFCLVASAVARPGDEVVLPLPFYFNHDMWLRMHGITPVYLEPGVDLVPRAAAAEALITSRTRAVVLVSPGNPSGVTVPPAEIAAFARLARAHDVALVIDETYRNFRDAPGQAHDLFTDPDWARTLVSLHSCSKDLAIPGYRVGAVVAAPELNREVEKLLDCVAVCAPRIGQEAALVGLTAAGTWRAERAWEIAAHRRALVAAMEQRPGGFELLSCGGFFGWLRHPFAGRTTAEVVRELIVRHDLLVVPGTAFLPDDRAMLRVSVGNADHETVAELAARLAAVRL